MEQHADSIPPDEEDDDLLILKHPALTHAIATLHAFTLQCKTPEEIQGLLTLLKPVQSILRINLIDIDGKEHHYYRRKIAMKYTNDFIQFWKEGRERDIKIMCDGETQNTLYAKVYHGLTYYWDHIECSGEMKLALQEDIMLCKPPSKDCIILKRRSAVVKNSSKSGMIDRVNGNPFKWKSELIKWMEEGDEDFRRSEIEVNDNLRDWVSTIMSSGGFEVVEFTFNTIHVKRI